MHLPAHTEREHPVPGLQQLDLPGKDGNLAGEQAGEDNKGEAGGDKQRPEIVHFHSQTVPKKAFERDESLGPEQDEDFSAQEEEQRDQSLLLPQKESEDQESFMLSGEEDIQRLPEKEEGSASDPGQGDATSGAEAHGPVILEYGAS